jgi:hypothetical protein
MTDHPQPLPPRKPDGRGIIWGRPVKFDADEITTKRCGCRVLRGVHEGVTYETIKACSQHNHRR